MAELSASAEDLLRLDAIYGFLGSATAVLHLCAGIHALPAAISDLAPGATAVTQDIAKPDCEAELRRTMAHSACAAFDLVIHHAGPVVVALNLATRFLASRGTFVAKVCTCFSLSGSCLTVSSIVIFISKSRMIVAIFWHSLADS